MSGLVGIYELHIPVLKIKLRARLYIYIYIHTCGSYIVGLKNSFTRVWASEFIYLSSFGKVLNKMAYANSDRM